MGKVAVESGLPKVLLASPLPPPEGGVAVWTQRILASGVMNGVALHHLDTSVKGGHERLVGSFWAKAGRSAIFMLRFIWTTFRLRPSVVHLTTYGFPGYYRDMVLIFLSKLLGSKVLVNLRFGDTTVFTHGVPGVLKPLVYASLRASWCVVPITRPMANVMHLLRCQRVEVIPNCVDIRSDFGIASRPADGNVLKVLYVGWVNRAKGIGDLLNALAKVEAATLTIIGPVISQPPSEEAHWITSRVEELNLSNRVHLMGRLEPEAARRAYREHDVLVLPSYIEGFPNVVLEAMEAGIPVIATRVGAMEEIVREKVDGILVNVGDVAAVTAMLRWMRENPEKRVQMGRWARDRVIQLFSVERVAELWVNLYERAMNDL